MLVNKKLCLLLVALYIIIVYKIDFDYFNKICSYFRYRINEIVDTLSFHDSTEKIPVTNLNQGYDEVLVTDSSKNVPNSTLSRRTIKVIDMLLSRIDQTDQDSLFRGRLEWEATPLELEALKNFGLGILTFQEVAPILNNVIKSAEVDGIYRSIHPLWNNLRIIKDITVAILILLYMFRLLRNVTWNFWVIFSSVIQVELIVTFFVTWWELFQGEHIEAIPHECHPDKMGWSDKIMELITSNCENHYEPKTKIHPSDVTLQLAFLHTIHKITFGVCSILLKFRADYIPWIDLWIIQPIVGLKGFSLVAFISAILALYCCYYHCSKDVAHTYPRPRRLLSYSETRMINLIATVLPFSYDYEGQIFVDQFEKLERDIRESYQW